jgi:hypothetical protein
MLGGTWNREEGRGGPRSKDQVVVGHHVALGELDHVPGEVDARNRGVAEGHIRLSAQDGPEWVGDIGGLEAGGSYLVEEGLEGMEVVLIDDDDVEGPSTQLPGCRQPGKTSAADHRFRPRRQSTSHATDPIEPSPIERRWILGRAGPRGRSDPPVGPR